MINEIDLLNELIKCKELGKKACVAVTDIIKKQPKIGEWILCSDRMPTKDEYLKDDGRFIVDDGNRRHEGLYDIYEGRFYSPSPIGSCFAFFADKNVIAWQPLPDPLKKK